MPKLLFFCLIFILLVTGCATNDTAGELASGSETTASELPAETPAESESVQPAQEQELLPEPEHFYCPFCGAEIAENAVFCHICGKKIEDFGKEEPWHVPESLDELVGEWKGETGVIINYPDYSLGTGFPMLSFHWPSEDVTSLWEDYSYNNDIPLDDMWEKKNVYRAVLHGDVRSDENGSQLGFVVSMDFYGDIIAQEIFFVPEKIIRDNIKFFLVSPDGSQIKMQGNFRSFSNLGFSISGAGWVYDKVLEETDEDWYQYW